MYVDYRQRSARGDLNMFRTVFYIVDHRMTLNTLDNMSPALGCRHVMMYPNAAAANDAARVISKFWYGMVTESAAQ